MREEMYKSQDDDTILHYYEQSVDAHYSVMAAGFAPPCEQTFDC